MINIKIIEGDVLNAQEGIIGHQVNCYGIMGAGLAKQIKVRYPNVFKEYSSLCNLYENRDKRLDLLGQCQFVAIGTDKYIANIFGQYGMGTSRQQTDYDALYKGLLELKAYSVKNELNVALPYGLGCGLAGGDWNIVSDMIADIFIDRNISLYKLG